MKKIFITVLFFNFFTCKEKSLNHNFEDNIKRNTYDILKVLYDDIIIEHTKMTVFQPLPPPPPNSEASLDSLFKIIEENRKV